MGTIDELFVDMDQLMDQMVRRLEPFRTEFAVWQPKIDVYEATDRIVIVADLSGVSRDDLRLSVFGPELVIAGLRGSPCPPDTHAVHQLEIESGKFMRRIRLSHSIDRENVSASFAHGLLTIVIIKDTALDE